MKQLLKEKLGGRTQRWLCQQIGMKEVDFSNSINGFRRFKVEEWAAIVEALGIGENDLSAPEIQSYEFQPTKPSVSQ